MKKTLSFFFALTVVCFCGFTQSNQKSVGMANLSNGGKISIMSVREVTSNNMFIKPDEGNRFVAFDIFIDNSSGNSDISINYVYSCFELKDTNGYSYKSDMWKFDLIKPSLSNDVTLERGDVLRGFLTFNVLQDAAINTLRIRFNNSTVQSGWINIR